MISWPKNNDALGTANRGTPCESGVCTLCDSACKGKCETWSASLRGRELLYPRKFGYTTSGSGNVAALGVGYHSLRIQGYAYGAHGFDAAGKTDADRCIFPNADISATVGSEKHPIKCRVPIMTGALGSTFVAARYWNSFAIGAALAGFPIVIGENVVGVDRKSVMANGRISVSPELDRRLEAYFRYFDGHGAIFVQMNVEDTRNGVAEYILEKYGHKVVLELKWGQGAKCIGGEIQVNSLEYAQFLKGRGYIVDPDPTDPTVIAAFNGGAVQHFARHSRLGSTDCASSDEVRTSFMDSIAYLRKIGFERISLKTGAYGMEALAMAMRYAADAKLDLLTIDGAGGGTGMSPWNMMEHWGVPSLPLHLKAYEYAKVLEKQGIRVPDLSFGGGLAREDHLFKALALGAPFTKLICMGRTPMIAAFVGTNIEGALNPERRESIHGHWEELPQTVSCYGNRPEQIFSAWETVAAKVGREEMKNIPYGAVAMFGLADKLGAGLQQFMAGARKFKLAEITRDDLLAANRETAAETGLPYLTEAQDDKALAILKG